MTMTPDPRANSYVSTNLENAPRYTENYLADAVEGKTNKY